MVDSRALKPMSDIMDMMSVFYTVYRVDVSMHATYNLFLNPRTLFWWIKLAKLELLHSFNHASFL